MPRKTVGPRAAKKSEKKSASSFQIPTRERVGQWSARLPVFQPMAADTLLEQTGRLPEATIDQNQKFYELLSRERRSQVEQVMAALEVDVADQNAFEVAFVRLAAVSLGLGLIEVSLPRERKARERKPRSAADREFFAAVEYLSQTMSERQAVAKLAEIPQVEATYRAHAGKRLSSSKTEAKKKRFEALWKRWVNRGKNRGSKMLIPLSWFFPDRPDDRNDLKIATERLRFQHLFGEFKTEQFSRLFEFPQR